MYIPINVVRFMYNIEPEETITYLKSERTKEEAGMFVVAHTKAWESQIPD